VAKRKKKVVAKPASLWQYLSEMLAALIKNLPIGGRTNSSGPK
jgi:hypothetical protein